MSNSRLGRSLLPALLLAAVVASRPMSARGDLDVGDFHEDGLDASEYSLLGTAWKIGHNEARSGGNPAPGDVDWSIMAAGIAATDAPHTGFSTTMDLNSSGSTTDEEAIINAALNIWASVAQIANLGKVDDGNVVPGAPQTIDESGTGGDDGEIRIGAYNFPMGSSVLAHAYQPGTEAQFVNGTLAGDIHFNNGYSWFVDVASTSGLGPAQFDFFTVVLHELGHALGLNHSSVGNIMAPTLAAGVHFRTLGADDVAGIQAIYGAIPEPSSFLFFVVVTGMMAAPQVKRLGKDGANPLQEAA